jgi:tetratricopeptide (TPR) repeat protein
LLIKTDKEDTSKVIHLNYLSREFINAGSYDSALKQANSALKIASAFIGESSVVRQSIKKGTAAAYSNIGLVYWRQGYYSQALDYYSKALKLNEELGYKSKIASALGNIGSIYLNQGDHTKALDYYLKALKTFEELKDQNKIATSLDGIGNIYGEQKEYIKALDYYFKALEKHEQLGDENGTATSLDNIGVVYFEQKDYYKAIEYLLKSLKIENKIEDKNGMAYSFGDLGLAYCEQAKLKQRLNKIESDSLYSKALNYFFKSLKINEELGNKNIYATQLGNIGSLYTFQKKYKEAEKYLLQSLAIDTTIGFFIHIENTHEQLSNLYKQMGDYKKSLYHYQKAMIAKDSIFNKEKNKDLTRKEMNYEFDKKELAIKAEHEKNALVAAAESKKQKIIILFVVVGLLIVMVFLIIVYRSLQTVKIQKQVIENQKEKVEVQNSEITKQKHIVEEKNKEISDSISYAHRIQSAFLTSETYIKRNLSEYFILYKPKDVVSGDFYWMHQEGNYFYFCIGDCTGHGIPGAFMSLIGMGILNEVIYSKRIENTNEILDELRRIVILALNPEGAEDEGQDGMDIVIGRLHLPTKELQYSAANNSFYIFRKGELIKCKPDKMPVGKYHDFEKPFTQNTIQLETNDIVYASTDGYSDQFGGLNERKFMSKQFEECLKKVGDRPLKEQREILEKIFDEWQGNVEQIDDVTVVGIKI